MSDMLLKGTVDTAKHNDTFALSWLNLDLAGVNDLVYAVLSETDYTVEDILAVKRDKQLMNPESWKW